MSEPEHEHEEVREVGDEQGQPLENDEAAAAELKSRLANVDTQAELPEP